MKRIFITFLFIFVATLSVNSQTRFVENFAYTAGDSIGAHGWVYNSGAANPLLVTSPGLSYTGYGNSAIGNALTVAETGNDAYKNWDLADSVGTVYCSFMINVTSATATGDYLFAMLPNNSTSLYTSRLTLKDSAGQCKFGLSKGTVASGVGYTAGGYAYGTTLLLVVKYKFNTGSTTDDETSLYVFTSGVPATEPGTATIPVFASTATDVGNLGRCAIRQGGATTGAKCVIDGFKVAKTWPQVVTTVNTISTVADKFALSQNYPNPFNPTTTIRFSLPTSGVTSLKVYDVMGKEVSNLVDANLNQGEYSTQLNASSLSSGMYFYKLEFKGANGQNFTEQKKLMLVK